MAAVATATGRRVQRGGQGIRNGALKTLSHGKRKALKRKPDKPVPGELTGEALGALKRDAQYRACR